MMKNNFIKTFEDFNNVNTFDVDEVLKHYLICALWVSELDSTHIIEDIDSECVAKSKKDIESFLNIAKKYLNNINEEQIGHDFWLTRNGHGTWNWILGFEQLEKILEKNE